MPNIFRTSVWCDVGSAMLKNINRIVESMLDSNNTDDKEHPHAKDNYYAGYYFSNTPYSSEGSLPGRKTDEELRSVVAARLRSITHIDTTKVVINVVDQVVSITGSVQTYEHKRRIAEDIWKIDGVVKVLNELHVTEPSTLGPT